MYVEGSSNGSEEIISLTPIPLTEVFPLLQTPTPTPKIERLMTPTATPHQVPRGGVITVSLQSGETITDWYQSFWREARISIPTEKEFLTLGIDKILGPVFSSEYWEIVRIGRVYYTHSGWSLTHGPEFGEMFLRILEEERLDKAELCFEELCYLTKDYVLLKRSEIGEAITLETLFSDIGKDDIFFVTCSRGYIPSFANPKLIIQLEPKPP